MSTPKRIQRSRAKGLRMPEGARYVGRGTRWGNPYIVLRGMVTGLPWFELKAMPLQRVVRQTGHEVVYSMHAPRAGAVPAAVELFGTYVRVQARDFPRSFELWIAPLRGKDLACWCPLDQPCHADVLLEVANR